MPLKRSKGYINQVCDDISTCTSCGTCELVCATVHEGKTGPSHKRLWLLREPFQGRYVVATCQQCEHAPCYQACPKKDEALRIDEETGVRYINEEECISCLSCRKACPYEPSRINFDTRTDKVVKCDFCKDEEKGPTCVRFCPALCLELATGRERK